MKFYQKGDSTHTRTINPYFGLLGFLGLLGPIAYTLTKEPFTLVFLGFFGFFGFYFEGKMSNTLKDERFLFNEQRSMAVAGKVTCMGMAFSLIIAVNWVATLGTDISYLFLISSIALMWATYIFLQMFLLYYYETKE